MTLLSNAQDSRTRARNNPLLVQEGSIIDLAVSNAVEAGGLTVEISDSLMTEPGTLEAQNYYKAWKGLVVDEILSDQMNTIIRSYQDRGYKITRTTNNQTLNTFKWIIRW